MIKFINFGCWNKYGCSQVSAFNKISNEASKITDIDFLIVNGDNYYQDKINGIKMVNNSDLLNGLNCLNKITDNTIYLLLGNHDLEVTDGHCETLVLERAFSLGVNSQAKREKFQLPNNLVMFKEIGDTIIIMIDSNIYANENPMCFKVLSSYTSISNSSIEEQLASLKQKQYDIIREKLQDKHYKNIIVSAHHPLIGFRNQIIKNEGNLNKVKGGLDLYNVDFYKLFFDLLRLHGDNFFHLCSDIHNYQQGIVTINTNMVIQQYIVGTGGADLDDDYNEKYNINYGVETITTNTNSVLSTNITVKDNITLTYDLQKHYSDYGFIIVTIDSESNINIESIKIGKEESPVSGTKGGNKSKRKFKFKKKTSKTHKK